jgi:choloylglycine hydrolase
MESLHTRAPALLGAALGSLLLLAAPLARAADLAGGPTSCTSTCLDQDGWCVFGTNLDWHYPRGLVFVNKRSVVKAGLPPPAGARGSTVGRKAEWTSRYGSVTFNLLGYQFAWGGMNEAGLVASTMFLQQTRLPDPDPRPSLPSPLWLQYQLDRFSTVQEVIASDADVRIDSGSDHYLFCDRTGACAVIEFLDGKMVASVGASLPVKALTNDPYQDSVNLWRRYGRVPRPSTLKGWRSMPPVMSQDSPVRFGIAADLLASYARDRRARLAVERVPPVLPDAAAIDYALYVQSIAARPTTAWTIVYDPRSLKLYFRTERHPHLRRIDLGRLDFSGKTPVRMLDIQADLAGDVTERLPEYSPGLSLDAMLDAFHAMVPGVSDDFIAADLRRLESFPCAEVGEAAPNE